MTSQFLSTSLTTALLILLSIVASYILIKRHLLPKATKTTIPSQPVSLPPPTPLIEALSAALPHNTILPTDTAQFKKSTNVYWAQQECENIPSCIAHPSTTFELSIAIKILKAGFDERSKSGEDYGNGKGLFAVRGGGHSPVSGAASIKDGVLIDLSLFNEVTPSKDKKSVVIGAGCKWGDVYRVLDKMGLSVVGGRNSAVGVGGLTLGGGISFFSPRFGLVCSNIISYEIVLADGSIITASETSHPDLWKALKGGGNNFGIVTRFIARCFPGTQIWAGFLYLPAFQAGKVLAAFHNAVQIAASPQTRDDFAAGPITSFSYVAQLGFQVVAVQMAYTSPPENDQSWPRYWKRSRFAKFWRIWSTCKMQSLSSATDELSSLNPPGRRQIFATCTIRNDLNTIATIYSIHQEAISAIKEVTIKGIVWTLIFQPFLPDWAIKGDLNVMGFDTGRNEALINVSFTVNWDEGNDDVFVKGLVRESIERIEKYANERGMGHKWRYLNYCAEWQRPFEGYGEGAVEFLRGVSERVDPDGLFQRGCVGGFKLEERVV